MRREEVPFRTEISRELTSSFEALHDALGQERNELQREVLLWQRWIRYSMVLVVAGLIAVSGVRITPRAWQIVAIAGAAYFVFNALSALLVRVVKGEGTRAVAQGTAFAADLAMMAVLIYVSSPPSQYHRLLLLGFLIFLLNLFYVGRRMGIWALTLLLLVYALGSLVAPAYVPGPRPLPDVIGFNAGLFLFTGIVLIITLGTFRERMNRFRVFCKRAEIGDLSGSFETKDDPRPDDLTLLARSFNAMRGRLIELIGTDPLTGVMNRRALETRLQREWRYARRRDSSLAILVADIDFFKNINDTHGHAAGDTVLQDLGEIMRSTARETDGIARLGGDEFVVLLPDTGWQGAMTFAERLRQAVESHSFGLGDGNLELTISIGVAIAQGTDDISMEVLLEQADRSLYKAKSGGRNRISA